MKLRADDHLMTSALGLLGCTVLFWLLDDRRAMVWTAAVGAWAAIAALYWGERKQ